MSTVTASDWIKGIPARGPVNAEAAGKMLSLMAELGGSELVGDAKEVPAGLFADIR